MENTKLDEKVLIQILDMLPDGVLWLKPYNETGYSTRIDDYAIHYLNSAAATFLGLSGQTIIGRRLIAEHLIADTGIRELLFTHDLSSKEVFVRQVGKWLHINKQPFNGSYLIRFTDITDTKEQRQSMEKLASRLQQTIDTSQAGSFYTSPVRDENGKIIDWVFNTVNQTVADFVGLKAEDLIGESGSKWFPGYMVNGLFDKYVETYTTGETIRYDLHYYDEGRIDAWVDFMITKIGDELLITLADYTPIKKLQLQLEASVHELKRSNESLGQFAYAASHDLQEPLRKISIYIDKLEKRYSNVLDDEGYSYIERIQTVTKRMRRLIQDLLIFAEVGAGQTNFEDVDLTKLVQDVVNDLEVSIQERDGSVQFEQLGSIKGDSIHLQQLFQNLISNSLKYSKPDVAPVISIISKQITGQETGIALTPQDMQRQFFCLELKDNGQGFTQEQAAQIFKIFQRLPQHRNEYTGTGIGLAIVKRVVENHRGYIVAEGEPGVGATFHIYIPIT